MRQPDRSSTIGIVARQPDRGAAPPIAEGASARVGWGWLPALSLVSASGLLLIALANNGARVGAAWSDLLFWVGLLLVFVPTALRLLEPGAAKHERLGLVALLGAALYLVKLLHSPLSFTFSDELQHWRTASDMLQSGRLFGANPLLPVSPLYPGLENVTVALAQLSGLSLFAAGTSILAVARLVCMLMLYLLYEQASNSPQAAGIGALLYTANSNYLFFDAQFAYESLALPLAALALWAAARRQDAPSSQVGLTLVGVSGLAAVIVSHHVTTYALVAFLALWALVASVRSIDRRAPLHPRGLALLGLVASLTWLAYVATLTVNYLVAPLRSSFVQLIQLIAGEAAGRELFRSPAGEISPLWEQLVGYAAVELILLALPFGLYTIWVRRRTSTIALALAAGALAYPFSLAMRLTERGAEAANRGAAFLFVAVSFALAMVVVARPVTWMGRWRPYAFGVCATIIFVGGVTVGWPPPWARQPGPYLVAADTRSVENQGLAAADWARLQLGPDNRLVADRTNRLLMGSYGAQRPVTGYGDRVNVPRIFFASQLGPAEQAILRQGRVRYIVVDRRLSSALPSAGVYVERGEVPGDRHVAPFDPAALAKFNGVTGVSRVFDSGDIVIYRTGAFADEP